MNQNQNPYLARKTNSRPLRSGTRMSVRPSELEPRSASHSPRQDSDAGRLVWTSIVWWGCLPNTTHQRICSVCAISGLLRVKRPHVNANRNIRPRLVVLLLRNSLLPAERTGGQLLSLMHCPPPPTRIRALAQQHRRQLRSIVNRVSQPGVCFLRPTRCDGLLVRRVCAPPSSAATTRPPAKMSHD